MKKLQVFASAFLGGVLVAVFSLSSLLLREAHPVAASMLFGVMLLAVLLLDLHLLKYLHLLPRLRAWNPEMKIVLSVGGWGADGFSHMAMTEDGRRKFARSCLDAVEKYNLDGIDIDWEYPCSDAAGIGADPRDKENFTALLAALREYLG